MIPSKTYCINLDRRRDRWLIAHEQFVEHGLNVERFPAIDGLDFKSSYTCGDAISGCTLSHYFLIERAKILGLESIMIFEDDCVLHPSFNNLLARCLIELPSDWNMLYLGGSHRVHPVSYSINLSKVVKTLTTHAYIIHHSMYDAAIERFKTLTEPVDCLYAELQKMFNVYVTNPPLAWQRGGYSDIEGRHMEYDWLKSNEQC